jgi:hypothetical protein
MRGCERAGLETHTTAGLETGATNIRMWRPALRMPQLFAGLHAVIFSHGQI